MDQGTLWNACEDQDLDAYLKARVEALLADPQFLAWLDQQDSRRHLPFSRSRHGTTRRPCRRGRTTTAVARSCDPQRGAREPPAGPHHTTRRHHEADYHRFAHVHRLQCLCQVLAPDRHRITQVLTGGARGAEVLGYRWAWKHAVRHQCFRAAWERFGKVAGVRRNHQLAQAGDVLIVFEDGQRQAPRT